MPENSLLDARGVPLALSLRSVHALDARVVGDGASLLAAADGLGLPVADGMVVTLAGVAATDPLPGLRHAWRHTRGTVRIALSDRGPGGLSTSPATYDAGTLVGLLDGVYDVLAHDRLENPDRRDRPWGILVLKIPRYGRSALLEAGDGKRCTVWTAAGGLPLERQDRKRLQALGRLAQARLGRPLTLEALDTGHGDWQIVDLRYSEPLWPGTVDEPRPRSG